ncbi:APC family permease [Planctomicrobium sp. SH527]|uniref:APC family permease n=1 Tax=Planctomicrobium sp. SH527 TaxID=3448123 RepID=UPI003F5C0D5D
MRSKLRREIGVFGAMMMGLGAIVGTGVFVSIGIAAGVTGPSVVLAIVVAGFVATFNGLSSAQLAANHPVSGGTYEYGYRWLHPSLGFTAGWMFLCAKSASAATAALGLAGYAVNLFWTTQAIWTIPLAIAIVVVMTTLVLTGIQQSNRTNIAIVSVTLISLVSFLVAGLPTAWRNAELNLDPFFVPGHFRSPVSGFLEACALMFVAFTGYGRIATLGEEVIDPKTTIPKAIVVTLVVSSLLYIAVGLVGVAAGGSETMAAATFRQAAPLEVVAHLFGIPIIPQIIAIGAMTAMLGVLLNLILGLSRILMAMGRRGDMPSIFARISESNSTPTAAVIGVGLLIATLTLIGNVKTTWSFSAFTVLVYYALTNLAAIRLNETERFYPKAIPWLGLITCLSLAFWVDPHIWGIGLGFIMGGLAFQWTIHRLYDQRAPDSTGSTGNDPDDLASGGH